MKCEAAIHSLYCKGEGNTRDHFTPRCLGTLDNLKWVNYDENFQYLDRHCHILKDHDTKARLIVREQQKKGAFVSLSDYLEIFSIETIRITEWNEKELLSLLKTYVNRPVELAMILEEIETFF